MMQTNVVDGRPYSVEKARLLSRQARGEITDKELIRALDTLHASTRQPPSWLAFAYASLISILAIFLLPASSRRD
jgi:hypothetical protein